ncbi:hypothetical protein LINPERPRIM_LOCUS37661 [Linum perenne]
MVVVVGRRGEGRWWSDSRHSAGGLTAGTPPADVRAGWGEFVSVGG